MTEAWLDERLQLFATFCAPSVAVQTETRFTWLWYLDPDTPLDFLENVKSCSPPNIQVEIRHASTYETMLEDTKNYIRQLTTPFVITTRLDNDDIISRDFMASVQAAFMPVDRTIINFLAGYEYSTSDHVLKRWNVRYMNQFISLIESTRAADLLTIYQFPHWKKPEGSQIIDIGGSPYWMYLRHGLNFSEQKINAIPVFMKSSGLSRFPACRSLLKLSFLPTLRYAVVWFPGMMKRRWSGLFRRISGS